MIQEIPIDTENDEDETNQLLIKEEEEIPIDTDDKNEEKEIHEEIKENVEPLPKKPRGRPKGSTKPKKEPPPVEKPKVVKPKPKSKKAVHYESDSEEEMPQYVRQQLPERDLATQMMQVLQRHNNVKADARKQLYSSWFRHF